MVFFSIGTWLYRRNSDSEVFPLGINDRLIARQDRDIGEHGDFLTALQQIICFEFEVLSR